MYKWPVIYCSCCAGEIQPLLAHRLESASGNKGGNVRIHLLYLLDTVMIASSAWRQGEHLEPRAEREMLACPAVLMPRLLLILGDMHLNMNWSQLIFTCRNSELPGCKTVQAGFSWANTHSVGCSHLPSYLSTASTPEGREITIWPFIHTFNYSAYVDIKLTEAE